MKRKLESDAPEQKEKKKKTDWIEIPDVHLSEDKTLVWVHWPASLDLFQRIGDQTLPPYRVSLTGPRIAAIKEEGVLARHHHHHHTCTCPACGDWKDYQRERKYASVSWLQKRLHKRDYIGDWQANEVYYKIDPLWARWTSFRINTNDVIWFQYTDEQVAERGRQEFPFYIPPGVANIIMGYAYSRPQNHMCILFHGAKWKGEIVRVQFDPAVLIDIEKS